MGGKWSLVQIQSPRPFFLSHAEPRRPCPGAISYSTRRSSPPGARPARAYASIGAEVMDSIAGSENILCARLADWAYRGGASFVALLPEGTARGLGRVVADLCWRLSPRRRLTLIQNLKRLLPELDTHSLGTESRRA